MASLTNLDPATLKRRSFIYRKLVAAGAEFAEVNGGAVAMRYPARGESEAAAARRMALADLSVLPHGGFKGRGTVEWLTGQGLAIGADSNKAYVQAGGELAARLAPTEIFLLDSLQGTGQLIGKLNNAWQWAPASPRPQQGYPTPRQDSHGWFMVTGEKSAEMFAKICGVDLRPKHCPVGTIAQTSIAKMSGIIIRADLGGTLAYHLLADIASAEYLWTCLEDAIAEYDGGIVGLAALRSLQA
ncbi:MAG: sarcosine oxidase [Rhodospirillum sp.]|nr:sarcosine oxidase [Rhodospirillum sp.]